MLRLKERRSFPRLNGRIFILRQLMEEKNINILKGFTNNISAGGLMFEAERPINCAERFILEIYQPQGESQDKIISVTVLANVKWIKEIHTSNEYEGLNKFKIGMEFINIDDKTRKIIAGYVRTNLSA